MYLDKGKAPRVKKLLEDLADRIEGETPVGKDG